MGDQDKYKKNQDKSKIRQFKVLPGHCQEEDQDKYKINPREVILKFYQVTVRRETTGDIMSSHFSSTCEIISGALGHL